AFYMSGGTISLQNPNILGSAIIDFMHCGSKGTVTSTGGTVEFGNAATPAGKTFSFKPFNGGTYPNFKITGPAGNAISLQPSANSTANFRLLSLYVDVNKTFDIRSIIGTFGD